MDAVVRRPLRARTLALAAALLVSALAVGAQSAGAQTPAKVGPPNSMDALGDSITRGFHAGSGLTCFPILLTDCPQRSWSTGSDTAVNSHYNRIRQLPGSLLTQARTFNDAVTGAKMTNLDGQAANAVARNPKPELVTVLLGANDACTSTEAGMTPVTTYRTQFETAMRRLNTGLPDSRVYVVSVPNIYRLWDIGRVSSSARSAWSNFSICQSMLANPTSTAAADEARRVRVRQRVIDYNEVLRQVCAQYVHCRFDNNAAFNTAFVIGDMSTIDFFHPNTQGQAKAATVTYAAGFDYGDREAPSTTITPARVPDGLNDWYNDDVDVSLPATDNSGVSGTEYFYKLEGAEGDTSWKRYDPSTPITINAEGITDITARSVDVNGNVEASKSKSIKIDKTKPTIDLTTPDPNGTNGWFDEGPVTTAVSADDDRQLQETTCNLDSEPVALEDVVATARSLDANARSTEDGEHRLDCRVLDIAGNWAAATTTFKLDSVDPEISVTSPEPNGSNGWFKSGPVAATIAARDAQQVDETTCDLDGQPVDLEDATTTAQSVDATVTSSRDGEHAVDCRAVDAAGNAAAATTTFKLDTHAPNAPAASADRAPEFEDWFKDQVTVSFADQGDPAADDQDGSGVDPASVPAAVPFDTSGAHTATGTVRDVAGNESAPGSATVKVDADAPRLTIDCPTDVTLNGPAAATVQASDPESGLVSDPSGSPAVPTDSVGLQTASASADDNVGHHTQVSCEYRVKYAFGGVLQPVNRDGSSLFKLGSTIPVKFQLRDAGGAVQAEAGAKLSVAKLSGDVSGTEQEAVSTSAATSDNSFRYDAKAEQYIFNLATKPLSAGTYRLTIALDDGTKKTVDVSVR